MAISLITKVRALFARDEYEYWFNHFTDEEKQLSKMTAWELAQAIDEASVLKNTVKKIVAEHMLNLRLAKLQANASWRSAIIGLVGVIVGSLLTVWLPTLIYKEANVAECKPQVIERIHKETEKQEPIK